MRVSTSMIYDAGIAGMNNQTASLLRVQQQLSSGRRLLSPADDPVAAARALEISQSSETLTQLGKNQQAAQGSLAIEEASLSDAQDALQRARELAIQAGNTTLSSSARRASAMELRGIYDRLLGIANAKDSNGKYVFGGYMSDTQPFTGSLDQLVGAGGDITYSGDDGQRTLQVSSTRYIETSDSGKDVFLRVANGNGYFATDYVAANTGTGSINSGSVDDPAAWRASASKNVQVRFTVSGGVTTYDLIDTTTSASLLGGTPRAYLSGQQILLKSQGSEPAFDLGGSVVITGTPANGDAFDVAPSSSQSVFGTLAKLVGAMEKGNVTAAGNTRYIADVSASIASIDQALNKVVQVHATVGTRMNELDALQTANGALNLQYQDSLSQLQDVDYASAITELTRRQTELQAAQASFTKISKLSLFDYLS